MERIELRCAGGPLLGVLVGGTAIEIKRGLRLFEVDLAGTQASGEPVILERVLAPESEGERRAESVEADESPAE
jgi:hypothetical protein